MSAFMVSKAHIDAIVATAIEGPSDGVKGGGYGQANWYSIYFDNPSRKLDYESAHVLGEMLVKENLSSIHSRYPDTIDNPDDTPGPIEQYWLEQYKFPIHTKPLTVVQALKAIHCYEYQSCEHDEWESSQARRFCEGLTSRLIGCLPGYEQAEWELTEA